MAKLSVSSGGRGRPLSIDPEKELADLMFDIIPAAQKNLANFRKQTSGVRGAEILGTETTLPAFIQTSLDILYDLTEGNSIDYATLKELRANLQSTRQLASKQARVFGRALEPSLTKEYFSSLDYAARNSNDLVQQSNKQIKDRLAQLTPRQRQQFFMSRQYQDPRTQTQEYQRVVAWASKQVGRQVSTQEAWAILRASDVGAFVEEFDAL